MSKKTTHGDSYHLKVSDRAYGFFIYFYDEVRGHILLFTYPTHLKSNENERNILAIHPAWWHQERFLKSEKFNTMDLELSGVVYSATLFVCDAKRLKRRPGMETTKWRQERFVLIVKAPAEVSFIAQEILQEFHSRINNEFKGKLCYLVEHDLGIENREETKENIEGKRIQIQKELNEICASLIPSIPINKLANLFRPVETKETTAKPDVPQKKLRFSVPTSKKIDIRKKDLDKNIYGEDNVEGGQKNKEKESLINIYKKSGLYFKPSEFENMEVTDFSLGDCYNIGIGDIIYINSERVCAKELALMPYQICPQNRHPDIEKNPGGKEETFRCRWGELYLYTEGDKTDEIKAKIPHKYQDRFEVFHEIILKPGDQYTLNPNIWHWFQAGPQGAVLSEFSTHSYDAGDIFYDKNIKRIAVDN